jgi:hypothetical protein
MDQFLFNDSDDDDDDDIFPILIFAILVALADESFKDNNDTRNAGRTSQEATICTPRRLFNKNYDDDDDDDDDQYTDNCRDDIDGKIDQGKKKRKLTKSVPAGTKSTTKRRKLSTSSTKKPIQELVGKGTNKKPSSLSSSSLGG